MRTLMTAAGICEVVVAALLMAGIELRAQATPPGADTVLDNYVKAIGGRAAFDKLHTRIMKARLEMPAANLSMAVTAWAARPNKMRTLVESDVVGRIERGFDGAVGWEVSTTSGPQVLRGAQLEDAARDSRFDGLAAWRDWVAKAENLGTADVDGKPAWRVRLTPKQGAAQTYFFDQSTSLAVKMETTVRSQMGDIPVETYLSDYRDVGGVRAPHRTRQIAGAQEIVTAIESIAHNVEIPAGQFDLPQEIQALVAKK